MIIVINYFRVFVSYHANLMHGLSLLIPTVAQRSIGTSLPPLTGKTSTQYTYNFLEITQPVNRRASDEIRSLTLVPDFLTTIVVLPLVPIINEVKNRIFSYMENLGRLQDYIKKGTVRWKKCK